MSETETGPARNPLLRLAARAGPVFLAKVSAAGLAVALHLLLTRSYSQDVYGVYVLVLSMVGLAVIPGRLGMDTASIRFVGVYLAEEDGGMLAGFIRASHWLSLACCLALGLLALGLHRLELLPESAVDPGSLLVGCALIPAFGLLAVLANLLTSLRWPGLSVSLNEVLRPVLIASGVLAFWLAGFAPGSRHLLLVNLAATLACCLLLEVFIQRMRPEISRSEPRYNYSEWVRVGLSHSIISGSQFLLKQADILMLGFLLGPREVALYSVATRLSDLSLFAQTALNAIVAPTISELYAKEEMEQLRGSLLQAGILMSAFSAAILVFFYLVGAAGLGLFGEKYVAGLPILLLLALGKLYGASLGPVGMIVSMTGHQDYAQKAVTASVVANVALNYALIPRYGGLGAAVATVASNTVRNTVLWLYCRRVLELDSCWVTHLLGRGTGPRGPGGEAPGGDASSS